MNKPAIWMFAGQGSQYYGMGRRLYEEESTFKKWIDYGTAVVEGKLGFSLTDILYGRAADSGAPFVKTIHSHPALFVLQYALAQTLIARGMRPRYVLGYSLGEFVAHCIGGTISYAEALGGVIRQAQVLEATCTRGAMLAILESPDILRRFRDSASSLEVGAVNSKEHFVVSGTKDSVQRLHEVLRDSGTGSVLLPVEYAYHSSYVDEVLTHDRSHLGEAKRATTHCRVISATYRGFVDAIQGEYFGTVIRAPVRFDETVRLLESTGEYLYLDLGPSGTLANFVIRNLGRSSRSRVNAIMTPYGLDNARLGALLAKISALSNGSDD
jgi:trans-AT polyketide synthase/acyltransferase/oxidoreductase domain-containing protein